MKQLEVTLRMEYEENHGKIDEKEEFITALENNDDGTLKAILFKYAEDLRDRRTAWREGKMDEDKRKKE
eukprot:5646867-Amphidinium_carterae.1